MKLLANIRIATLSIIILVCTNGCFDSAQHTETAATESKVQNYDPNDWSTANDIYYFSMMAEKNDTKAMRELHRHYRYAHGVKKDLHRAINYLKKASSLGDSEATRKLINVYSKGVKEDFFSDEYEIDKNPSLANSYTEVYTQQLVVNAETNPEAAFWLARYYEKKELNIIKAQQYYEKSNNLLIEQVSKGDAKARLLFAKLRAQTQHPSIIKNEALAIKTLHDLVTEGNREAHLLLARVYLNKAMSDLYDFVKKASNLTDVQAKYKGRDLLIFAAKRGDAEAQRRLVNYYESNRDLEKNSDAQIVNWVTRAILQV